MKTVRIIALKQDRKRLLEHLQDYALVQVKKSDKVAEGFSRVDMTSQMQVFEKNAALAQQALDILDRNSKEKKGLLSSFSGRRQIDPDELGVIASNSGKVMSVCSRIVELNKQITDNSAEQARIKTTLAQLEPWQSLDVPLNLGDTPTTAVFIGSLPQEYTDKQLAETIAASSPQLEFEFEIEYSSPTLTCVMVLAPLAQKSEAENVLRTLGFARPMNPTSHTPKVKAERLREKSKKLNESTQTAKNEIASYADRRDDIRVTQDYFRIRTDKYNVINSLDQTKHVFVLTGFVPEEDCEKLEELCTKNATCCVEFSDADEDAPVKLKNNAFAQPAQNILTMYAPPSHADIDPTPILAFFFYFFFGMMFSDAGYGLLMAIATGIMIKKFKPDKRMRDNLKLFQYCGISTFIWGLIFGSFFGDAPAIIYNYITGASITMADIIPWPTLDPQKDALTVMALSIALGLVHILVGMGCKFYVCLKQKDYGGAFFDTGFWMLLLIGIAVLAIGAFTSQTVMYVGAGIAVGCAVGLLLTQGRSKKGIFGKIIGGLVSLYDITGYISDLLSYSRLLALGLTTGVMAQVFNMLSSMFGKNILGCVFMIIIMILGHAINIGLNALGSYVHTMRLQYVEMFGKFYEGGGKEFEPFSLNSKYIKIQEDK